MKQYYDEKISEFHKHDLEPESSIQDLCDAVLNTLKYWVAIHTDAESWAENWLAGYEPSEFLEHVGKLENGYFSVDLKEKVLEQYIDDNLDNFSRCIYCGQIDESGYECCDCSEDDFEDDEDTEWNDDHWETPDKEDLLDWFSDIGLPNDLSENTIFNAIVAAFDDYYESVEPVFRNELEMIENAINDIELANNNAELLAAVLAGTQVYHVNGQVMDDYGEVSNLDYKFVDSIRNDGLLAHFTQEEIDDFMENE